MTVADIIPMNKWGRDHWSTLAFVATVMADRGQFVMTGDARMRSNRKNFQAMPSTNGIVMRKEHGSRLSDGSSVEDHDDWCCIQDFAAEGLLTVEEIDVGERFRFSNKGQALVTSLLTHKMKGGTFSNYKAPGL